jgi:putative two-component system response regulator
MQDVVAGATTASVPNQIAFARIAIIDDDEINVQMITRRLERLGFRTLIGFSDPTKAIEALEEFQPDVVLLDVVMPDLSGPELLQQMRQHPLLCDTPVITLTASRDRDARLQIIELGVSDFLNKPVDEIELSTRLRNVIEAKRYREYLAQSAEELETAVRQRTQELETSRREVVMCLARAAESRDDSTGRHVIRVGRYAAILAAELGWPESSVEMIEFAAQLHDVGKIGIPDSVLRKPGRLTDDEMNIMRRHAEMGWNILVPIVKSNPNSDHDLTGSSSPETQSPMLLMAAKIALNHHERWDGKGYPRQLSGDSIPLEARITAVADVFDALSTPRCYKLAIPLDECYEIIRTESGRHFDPQIVDAFQASRFIIQRTFHELADQEAQS